MPDFLISAGNPETGVITLDASWYTENRYKTQEQGQIIQGFSMFGEPPSVYMYVVFVHVCGPISVHRFPREILPAEWRVGYLFIGAWQIEWSLWLHRDSH